jgi:ABC-type transporter Mla subunit MlaD
MNSGADTLHAAASEFAKAGQGVSGALAQAGGITEKLSQAASAVGASTKSLEAVVIDYKATREMVAQMLGQVQSVVEAAKKEAAITADVLSRIEGAAAKLTNAQQEADTYLMRVSEILTQTHQDFATHLRRTLNEGNRQFYDQLSTATGLLREAIEELQTALADVSVRT